MKNILFFVFILYSISMIGQTFEVTPDGLRDIDNTDKSYLVLSFPGKSANELYKKSVRYMNEIQSDPDASSKSNLENEYLRFRTIIPSALSYKQGFIKIAIDLDYNTELKFKDGKVRIEFVGIKMPAKDYKYSLVFSAGKMDGYYIVYDNKGKLYKKEAKEDLERIFNTRVMDYLNYMSKEDNQDDW